MSKETPPPPHDDDERRQEKRQYHHEYWRQYKKTRRRVTGTLTETEYTEIEQRANEAGRAVWTQIHAEAAAYARGEYLPTKEIDLRISELIMQFRRLGNNINQIARELNTDGGFDQPEFVQNLEELETLIRAFVKMPWGDIDREPPES